MGGRAGPDQGDDAARADGVTDGVESTESERVRSKHHRGTTTSLAKQAASERATTKRRSERAACYPRAGPLTHLRATEDHVSTELIIMPPRSAFRALLAILPLALSSLALAPGSDAAGGGRGGEEESGQALGCQYRRRHRAAHRRRRLPEIHRHAAPGGPLPRPHCGLSRSSVRPRRSVLRFDAVGAALHHLGPGQG